MKLVLRICSFERRMTMKILRLLTIVTTLTLISLVIIPGQCLAQQVQRGDPNTLSVSYSYSQEDLILDEFEGFDRVTIAETGFICTEGEPYLPAKHVRLALPFGWEASHLSATTSGEVLIDLQRFLLPGIRPLTGNSAPQEQPDYVKGPVYEMDSAYPGTVAELIRTGTISGFPLAEMIVYPVQYNPVQHEMVLYTKIDIQIALVPSGNPEVANWGTGSEGDDSFRMMVQNLVDNPDAVPVPEKRTMNTTTTESYPVEYLIITDDAFVAEFQRLAEWKIKKGIWTEIITVNSIYQTYSGVDSQDQIRNCIKDYKNQYGSDLKYVLLGGDKDIIPCRTPFVSGINVLNSPVPESIYKYPPSDLYYSALEDSWDGDGDGLYGEYPDDNISEYLDWLSDVFLGRAPVDNEDQAGLFVDKVLLCEGVNPILPLDYQKNLYFLSTNMDTTTNCSILKNQIEADYVNYNGNNFFNVTKEHMRPRGYVINQLNEVGRNVINHAGHGWVGGVQTHSVNINEYLRSIDVYSLTNSPRLSAVMYSTSCFSGAFDEPLPAYTDCFGEYFVLAPDGGGAAYIGNSRYGFYWPVGSGYDTWNTLSNWYDKAFFIATYEYGYYETRDNYHLGKAFTYGRHNYGSTSPAADPYTRCCMYEQNLFGDPEMPIFKNRLELTGPDTMVLSHVATVKTHPFGKEFKVAVKLGSTGENVVGANVCLWKQGDIFTEEETDEEGVATFNLAPDTGGTMYVTATKIDRETMIIHVPSQSTVDVIANLNPLIADRKVINIFEPTDIVNFVLNAQPANAGRTFFMFATMSGKSPGILLPGGATLPLNHDFFMDYVIQNPNSPMFTNFVGTLDVDGKATAAFDHHGLLSNYLFERIHFAYALANPSDYASNAVPVFLTNISGAIDPR